MDRLELEKEWRLLSGQLYRLLAKRGVPAWVADDIVQETAARLLAARDVDPRRPVAPYARTIALNLLIDHYRRLSQTDVAAEIPEVASGIDVPSEVIARIEMQEVASALRHISPRQRAALLDDVSGAHVGLVPPRLRMLRLRARRALSNLIERGAAAGSSLALRFRRFEVLAKTFLPQVTAAVNGRFLFEPTQSVLAGVATVGLIAVPMALGTSPEHQNSSTARSTLQRTANVDLNGVVIRPDGPPPHRSHHANGNPVVPDEIHHRAAARPGYTADLPGVASAGRVHVEALARITPPTGDPTELVAAPACSITTSASSAGATCAQNGPVGFGVRVREEHTTYVKPIN